MIRNLVASAADLSWAGSLFAARQGAALAVTLLPGAEERGVERRLDAVTWEMARTLGGWSQEAFQVGDALQRDGADLVLPARAWSVQDWLDSARTAAGLTLRSARFATPGRLGMDAWRELANKVQVYLLVKRVAARVGEPSTGGPFDLATLLRRAYQLSGFEALWAVEGLGHDYAERSWPADGKPQALLSGAGGEDLPAKSLTMLHAGIGLAFAQRLLAELPPGVPLQRTADTVAAVLELCRANSRPGYEGAAIESLGLVTRTFHGPRLHEMDAALRRLGEDDARGFFWHGVGRALYFLPINIVPAGDTTWRPFEMALAEAPDPTARHNAVAGLGWAFTLVDMRAPELMERLLLAPHGASLRRLEGFANGVASSLTMRTDTTPGSELVDRFLGHRPTTAGDLWRELVTEPSRHALERVYPRLRAAGRLGEIFRYQTYLGWGAGGSTEGDRR